MVEKMKLPDGRLILHSDINHCFAQIEELKNSALRDLPMCVGGDEDQRHGIVLARNPLAKSFGVQTAEPLRDARRKCPNLVVVPAGYSDYHLYSKRVKDIYREYSDQVESFGLDEAWIDLTHSWHLFVDKPFDLPKIIQERVLNEIGLTVSIGVSWNKVYAKLGSDFKKPYGLTYITKANYKENILPLPIEDLLMVGYATKTTLNRLGIKTIGDCAHADREFLVQQLGKHGNMLWNYANGFDNSEVALVGYKEPPKSISNGTTPPHDIKSPAQAKLILAPLCESVAMRLRREELKGQVVHLQVRSTELKVTSRQCKIEYPTNASSDILKYAMILLNDLYNFDIPLRSLTIGVTKLKNINELNDMAEQLSLFDDGTRQIETENETMDKTVEMIRHKFGHEKIKRAAALLDESMDNFNPNSLKSVLPNKNNNQD